MEDEAYRKKLTEIKSGKNAPVVRIMATDDASYKNLVDALDEMNISSISRYAIVDLDSLNSELIRGRVN
jgi:biopolymer transport protein ExbD